MHRARVGCPFPAAILAVPAMPRGSHATPIIPAILLGIGLKPMAAMIGAEVVRFAAIFARVLRSCRVDRHPADGVNRRFLRFSGRSCSLLPQVVGLLLIHGIYLFCLSADPLVQHRDMPPRQS